MGDVANSVETFFITHIDEYLLYIFHGGRVEYVFIHFK